MTTPEDEQTGDEALEALFADLRTNSPAIQINRQLALELILSGLLRLLLLQVPEDTRDDVADSVVGYLGAEATARIWLGGGAVAPAIDGVLDRVRFFSRHDTLPS